MSDRWPYQKTVSGYAGNASAFPDMDERDYFEMLEGRIRTMLPEEYQDSFETMEPRPMRSAGLKYDADGKVAWDEIWGSFCDLAMAGGPPHKGTLLEPAGRAEIDAQPDRYREVVEEICRGVMLAADLDAKESPAPGWIRVACYSEVMAGWLLRAIAMENVSVRRDGATLELPSAPHFRLEKEIKNVITVIAKTCHYWMGHMPRTQKYAIADLFATMAEESPLVGPAFAGDGVAAVSQRNRFQSMARAIEQSTGLRPSPHRYIGWLGLECASVRSAIWMMRMMVASNILSRREDTVLFVPVNAADDPEGDLVIRYLTQVHQLAAARSIR
jgi:hypothetical protein